MVTTSSRRNSGVGGKIVKNKSRRFQRVNPYSRPSLPPRSDDNENPNWFSGLIYPAKFIANGAGKILSFFGNDYSSSSSSSVADSSENEEDDGEDIENDVLCQEGDRLDKVEMNGGEESMWMITENRPLVHVARPQFYGNKALVLSPSNKSDSKRAIEQLVIQESYSRKEANELINLVRSRIVDTNGTAGETTPNMRTTAIMEARKWLQDKRSGSKKSENELDFSNVASPSNMSRNEKGSPVDMARSYMQNRPAWASPSLKQAEVESSSPLGMLQFKDETPKSTLRSSELKRGSFTSGSWNLLEEIRRVRTKASEELLASAPLSKTILSPFSPVSNPPRDVLNKGDAEGAGPAGSAHNRPDNVLPGAAVSIPSRATQDGDAVQSVEHQGSQEAAGLTYTNNGEVEPLKGSTAENGFGSSTAYLAQGQDTNDEARPSEEGNGNLVDSSRGRDILMEESINPREEPVIDIPADNVVNGSQSSSSMKHEELSQDVSQPVIEDGHAAKVKDTPKERKSRGYTRRGRGKGK